MQPPQPKAPVLVAPTKVATAIPAPDLKAIPTVGDVVAAPPAPAGPPAGKSEGAGKDGESGAGKGNGGPSHEDGSAFSEAQVERAVEVVRNAQPKYPEIARNAGIQGVVAVRFIVGTDGRVEGGSIDVLSTPHDAFVAAVRAALLSTRYRPAEVGGRPVRQLVEQSFTFRLDR
jgi:protein TonB